MAGLELKLNEGEYSVTSLTCSPVYEWLRTSNEEQEPEKRRSELTTKAWGQVGGHFQDSTLSH